MAKRSQCYIEAAWALQFQLSFVLLPLLRVRICPLKLESGRGFQISFSRREAALLICKPVDITGDNLHQEEIRN